MNGAAGAAPGRTALAGVARGADPTGAEGVEVTGADVPELEAPFARPGFAPLARRRSEAVTS